jgi:hypothetical protein
LCLEGDLLGDARLLATLGILDPDLRQIQPIGDRQAGMMVGDRQRHHRLAVGLLAELAAILVMHADRVLALLGERRVVDDPGLDRPVPLDLRHYHPLHLGQHRRVGPRGVGNEMQKLLVLRRHAGRRRHRRHRLHASAPLCRQQPRAIALQRPRPIRMPDHARQTINVRHEPSFTLLQDLMATHVSSPCAEVSRHK